MNARKKSRDLNLNYIIRASERLKSTRRSGWVKKARIKDAESVADHSYRMALIGAILSEEMGLDSGKMVRMCLLHDLAESQLGDLLPEEKSSEMSHRRRENGVMSSILSSLPQRSKKKLSGDWKDLLTGKSREAMLVWQIDKLEMGLQMKDYLSAGHSAKLLRQFDPSKFLKGETKQILRNYH